MSSPIQEAIDRRDAHVRAMIEWHFSESTGCPFWLNQRKTLGFDPLKKIHGLDDLVEHFPNFDGDLHLRKVPMDQWRPKGIGNRPCSMFMTGGTTGDPKQRFGVLDTSSELSDIGNDYRQFATYLPAEGFAHGGRWAYLGPQGPRRLKRGVEILAVVHGADFIEIDMDAAWMKAPSNSARDAYKYELVERAIGAIKRNRPDKVFCPPILIQLMAERHFDWATSGVKGVFAGGTEMLPEDVRFIYDELFQRKIHFVPTFGNALVGLARPRPFATHDNPIAGQHPYQIIYQPLQPQTLLRVTTKDDSRNLVGYGEFGYVEITTLTKTWFMPRFRERDYARRIAPTDVYPWDGLGEIQDPPELKGTVQKGVY